ncbi:MAG: hypothetical protein GEU98_05640 [Pseudonocardiaceae bacterium]|nr:hypothetical protein [Pseudonocardiaceae bacterium]
MQRERARRCGGLLGGLATVVASVALVPTSSAAPAAGHSTERAAHYTPSAAAGERAAANGGGRTGDFTKNAIPDVLTRGAATGALKVYPHTGTFDGTNTYDPATTIGENWGDARWIGQGDLNKDKLADVLTVDDGGTLRVHPHTGTWDGKNTLGDPVVLGHGWDTTDLITTGDLNGDGFDDMVAHRTGTKNTFVYENTGGVNGTNTFKKPVLLATGPSDDEQLAIADITADQVPDVVAKRPNGELEVFSFTDGEQGKSFTIGYGWDTVDTIAITDINDDGKPDILGARNGALFAYPHSGGFDPNKPAATLREPVEVISDWTGNDVLS